MPSARRAFVVMPFGAKPGPDGAPIDFDAIYDQLLAPAVKDAGLVPHRADADRRGGSIHADMFQDLLLAEFVVADLTIDNPNVWYEIGVRHALKASGAVLTYALRDRLPFDIAGQRMQRYSLVGGKLVPERLADERRAIAEAITATLGAWRGRKGSPVYQQLPSLQEPDWKSLKVGDVNQFWQSLDDWRSRIDVARRKQKPGDILLLADETPNRALELEALRIAADALIKLDRPRFALNVLERARALDPDDIEARRLEGMALGRCQRYDDAREAFQRLAELRRNGEILGLLARTWKDEWLRSWNAHPQRQTDALAAARDTATTLRSAVEAYDDAFRADPANFYPGVNVVTLGSLWRHVTERQGKLDLDLIASGAGWAIGCALDRSKDYWALVSRAELAVVAGKREAALDDYGDAAELAVANRDRFALDSSGQTLDFLGGLGFQKEIVADAAQIIAGAKRRLDALIGPLQEPERVVLFSGHMIDNPADRGPGKAKPARFPAGSAEAASARISAALDAIAANAGDLGLCGGACGGDLLFAEACLKRGMRLEVRLAQPEAEFLAKSVTFADPDHRWERSFAAVTSNPATLVLTMPDELGPAPEGVDLHDRCNRWMLNSALSRGLRRVSFITLWDGTPGDGPGGTEDMVELVRKLSGRQPIIIDPKTL
jgi:tetratricopeptide (TPR) repeat protein